MTQSTSTAVMQRRAEPALNFRTRQAGEQPLGATASVFDLVSDRIKLLGVTSQAYFADLVCVNRHMVGQRLDHRSGVGLWRPRQHRSDQIMQGIMRSFRVHRHHFKALQTFTCSHNHWNFFSSICDTKVVAAGYYKRLQSAAINLHQVPVFLLACCRFGTTATQTKEPADG